MYNHFISLINTGEAVREKQRMISVVHTNKSSNLWKKEPTHTSQPLFIRNWTWHRKYDFINIVIASLGQYGSSFIPLLFLFWQVWHIFVIKTNRIFSASQLILCGSVLYWIEFGNAINHYFSVAMDTIKACGKIYNFISITLPKRLYLALVLWMKAGTVDWTCG